MFVCLVCLLEQCSTCSDSKYAFPSPVSFEMLHREAVPSPGAPEITSSAEHLRSPQLIGNEVILFGGGGEGGGYDT